MNFYSYRQVCEEIGIRYSTLKYAVLTGRFKDSVVAEKYCFTEEQRAAAKQYYAARKARLNKETK